MPDAWMRVLTVTLTSSKLKRQIMFGAEHLEGKDDLSINVQGYKYMSSLKDSCTIRISNLTYQQVIQIITGEFYNVEVKCGYQNGNDKSQGFTIFKGGVLYISNSIDNFKTHTIIILCASLLVAQYQQRRINLSLNSGINVYTALSYICRLSGIKEATISTQFKKQFVQEIINANGTPASIIDSLTEKNQSWIANSDGTLEGVFSIYDSNKSNARIIKLSKNTINLSGGYPKLTKDGLSLDLMPTFSFLCGDVIEIDNSLLDISISDKSQITSNPGFFLDPKGQYTIFEQQYSLANRSSEFNIHLTCKSRSLISNFIGV